MLRKLLLLGMMVGGLVTINLSSSLNTSACGNNALPCCSACEEDPTIPLCRRGCSPGC